MTVNVLGMISHVLTNVPALAGNFVAGRCDALLRFVGKRHVHSKKDFRRDTIAEQAEACRSTLPTSRNTGWDMPCILRH